MYGSFDPWELLFTMVLPIVLIVWLVSLIVRWVKRIGGHDQPGSPSHHLSVEELHHFFLGGAITIVTPLFLYFLEKTLLPGGQFSTSNATFQFAFGLGLGLVVFLLGLGARRVPVVGTSLASGGMLYIITIVTMHFSGFDPIMKLLIVVLGLLVVIATGYRLTAQDARLGRTAPTLSGLKGFGLGFLAFLFSGMVIINAVETFVAGSNGSDNFDAVQRLTFIISLGFSILFLILGLAIKVVRPLSLGLILTGALTIFYTLFQNFDSLGGTGVVLVTGVGLIALIWFAYHQFATHHPETTPPTTPTMPPVTKK